MKRLIKYILEVVCLLLLLPFLLFLMLQIGSVRQWVIDKAVQELAKNSDLHLVVEDFQLSPFFQLKIPKLTLEDSQGVFFEADMLTLSWNPFALLEREILISKLLIDRVNLQRLPQLMQTTPREYRVPETNFFSHALEIAFFQINQTELSLSLLGINAPKNTTDFSIRGSLLTKPAPGMATLTMALKDRHGEQTESHVALTAWQIEDQLKAHLQITDNLFGMLQVAINFSDDLSNFQGNMEGTFHEITLFKDLLRLETHLQGGALLKANFGWSMQDGGYLQLESELHEFVYDQLYLDLASLVINLQGDLHNPTGTIALASDRAQWKEWQIEQFDLHSSIESLHHVQPFNIAVKTVFPINLDLDLKGTWGTQAADKLLTFDRLTGTIENEALQLAAPWKFAWNAEHWHSTPLKVTAGESEFELILEAEHQFLHCSWECFQVPLEWLSLLSINAPLSGTFDCHGILKGTTERPIATSRLSFYTFPKVAHREHLTPLTGEVDFLCDSGHLEIRGHLNGIGVEKSDFYGTLPLKWKLVPFQFEIEHDSPIKGALALKSNITALFDFFSGSETLFTGDILLHFDLQGSLNEPEVYGKGTVSQGHFESLKSGAVLEEMHAELESNGREITIHNLAGRDPYGGTFNGAGRGRIEENFHMSYLVNFQLNQLHLMDLDFAYAAFDGGLQLQGNFNEASLKGQITASNAHIIISEDIPESSEVVDVTYINLPEGESAPTHYQDFHKKSVWPIALDFQVQVPQLQISGGGLISSWRAGVRVQGNESAPQLFGEASVHSGEYLFRGKLFSINQGTVTFAGEPDKKTSIYLVATHDIDDTMVEAILRGPISNPGISFRSSPSMSQQEILSWILFGRGLTEISAVQGAQLHRSVTNLKEARKEAAKGPNVLSKIQDTLGLDQIDIQRSPNAGGEQVSLQVGKHFSNGLYFSLNRNFTNNTTSLSIEAKLMRYLKLQAEISDNEDDQLMLKWKRDY